LQRQTFVVQANIWIFILSFIGNYVWTHYFYNLLGASYTFEAWRLNDVSMRQLSLVSTLRSIT
jgi:cycloeucalenol cycloisomerase